MGLVQNNEGYGDYDSYQNETDEHFGGYDSGSTTDFLLDLMSSMLCDDGRLVV